MLYFSIENERRQHGAVGKDKGEIEMLVLPVFPFGARIVAQGIVPVNVGGEKTENI